MLRLLTGTGSAKFHLGVGGSITSIEQGLTSVCSDIIRVFREGGGVLTGTVI